MYGMSRCLLAEARTVVNGLFRKLFDPGVASTPFTPLQVEPDRLLPFLALSIALVFGYFANPWAWIYFVFIVSMFTCRQRDDDSHCAGKYGAEKWAEYRARVKYRIVPGII